MRAARGATPIGGAHLRLARVESDPDERCNHVEAARAALLSIDRPDLVKKLDEEFGEDAASPPVGGSFIIGLRKTDERPGPESHQRSWWIVHTQPTERLAELLVSRFHQLRWYPRAREAVCFL
jgi:hypothetical protein